jgi:pyruvate formate lyase activating enzyme
MKNLPPTPADTLDRAKAIGAAEGLHYVYIGNIHRPDGETTFCVNCRNPLIVRRRYIILENRLQNGACPDCGTEAYGLWT